MVISRAQFTAGQQHGGGGGGGDGSHQKQAAAAAAAEEAARGGGRSLVRGRERGGALLKEARRFEVFQRGSAHQRREVGRGNHSSQVSRCAVDSLYIPHTNLVDPSSRMLYNAQPKSLWRVRTLGGTRHRMARRVLLRRLVAL